MRLFIHPFCYNSITSLFYTIGLFTEYLMVYCLTSIYRCICLNKGPTFT